MKKTEQEKREARIGRIVSNVAQLPDEDQIYILGNAEGLAAKRAIEAQKREKGKGV